MYASIYACMCMYMYGNVVECHAMSCNAMQCAQCNVMKCNLTKCNVMCAVECNVFFDEM